MIEYSKDQLIEMIDNYSDTMLISKMIGKTVDLLSDLDIEGEETYYLKEAKCNLEGMYELLLDIKKEHIMSEMSEQDNGK